MHHDTPGSGHSRRDFLRRSAVTAAAVAGGGGALVTATAAEAAAPEGDSERGAVQVERRTLGKTGAKVSILGLGLGSAFTSNHDSPEEAAPLLLRALEHGVNYWDTARGYGPSESLIGPTLKDVRDQVFMVAKSESRSYDGYRRDLDTTLKNLQTDHLDLHHIHNIKPKDNLKQMEDGCFKAAREAQEQGLIKHRGVTGHSGAAVLVDAIKRFEPDAVLSTFPASRPDDGKYEEELLPLARERKMGVIAMKLIRHARGADLKGTDLIRYGLSLDGVHVAIIGMDTIAHLDENTKMAANFEPLKKAEAQAMTRLIRDRLAGVTEPWLMPGYRDGVVV